MEITWNKATLGLSTGALFMPEKNTKPLASNKDFQLHMYNFFLRHIQYNYKINLLGRDRNVHN
jgi:hypothetical protein